MRNVYTRMFSTESRKGFNILARESMFGKLFVGYYSKNGYL